MTIFEKFGGMAPLAPPGYAYGGKKCNFSGKFGQKFFAPPQKFACSYTYGWSWGNSDVPTRLVSNKGTAMGRWARSPHQYSYVGVYVRINSGNLTTKYILKCPFPNQTQSSP